MGWALRAEPHLPARMPALCGEQGEERVRPGQEVEAEARPPAPLPAEGTEVEAEARPLAPLPAEGTE